MKAKQVRDKRNTEHYLDSVTFQFIADFLFRRDKIRRKRPSAGFPVRLLVPSRPLVSSASRFSRSLGFTVNFRPKRNQSASSFACS